MNFSLAANFNSGILSQNISQRLIDGESIKTL